MQLTPHFLWGLLWPNRVLKPLINFCSIQIIVLVNELMDQDKGYAKWKFMLLYQDQKGLSIVDDYFCLLS